MLLLWENGTPPSPLLSDDVHPVSACIYNNLSDDLRNVSGLCTNAATCATTIELVHCNAVLHCCGTAKLNRCFDDVCCC